MQGVWWITGFQVITTGLPTCTSVKTIYRGPSPQLLTVDRVFAYNESATYASRNLINMFKMAMCSGKCHSQRTDLQVREGHKFTTQIQALPHLADVHAISQNSSVKESCLMVSQYATILKISPIREIEGFEKSLTTQWQMSRNCFLVFMPPCAC